MNNGDRKMTFGYVFMKLFFAANCLAGFFLMLFGAGMIEHPETAVSLIGSLICTVGILCFIMFGVLLARVED